MNNIPTNQNKRELKGTDVIGLDVITLENGEVVDTVKDIIYDPRTNRVRALLIENSGLFSEAKVILTENIRSIGKDAVIIENNNVLKKASDVEEDVAHIAKDDTYLTRTKIVTEEGTELGHVTDLYFDLPQGSVRRFEVSEGGLKTLQSGRKHFRVEDIITIGTDATIVRGYTDQMFEDQANQQGMQGAFTSVKDQTGEMMEGSKQKAEELSQSAKSGMDQARTRADEMRNDPKNREKVDEWTKQFIQATNKAQNVIQDAFSDAQNKAQEMQRDPKNQERMTHAKDTLSQAKDKTMQKVHETQDQIEEHRKKEALGKYVKINVLSENDKILAKRGDMVTHTLLEKAEKNGILEQVLSNVIEQPVNGQVKNGEDVDVDLNVRKTSQPSHAAS